MNLRRKYNGAKQNTEAADSVRSGRGALSMRRSGMATERGALTSEDADMSNEKTGEIPVRRKPKDSRATFFVPGLVGT